MSSDSFNVKRKSIAKQKDNSKTWSTDRINQWMFNEQHNIKNVGSSPFFEDNIYYRKGELLFEYTKEEELEIQKCYNDIEYFADKYCYAMTDNGVSKIDLYDYQRDCLKCFKNNRYIVYLASRQVGKCSFANTEIQSKDKKINMVELYSSCSKQTFLQKIKKLLYKVLYKLDI